MLKLLICSIATFALLFVGVSSEFLCTRNATFGSCTSLDAFPVLAEISANMTILKARAPNDTSDTALVEQIRREVANLTDNMCRTSQPIINCINAQNFTMCEKEQYLNNEEAILAMSVVNSFRLITYGCSLFLSGGADVETDCPNYENLFKACESIAPNVPLISDFGSFLLGSAELFNLPRINATDCNNFKLRTGCIVSQFTKNCKSARSAELPWWMARYQLDLSQTSRTACDFTSDDTSSKLATQYSQSAATGGVYSDSNGNPQGGIVYAQQSSAVAMAASAYFLAFLLALHYY